MPGRVLNRVVFQPVVAQSMQQGIHKIVGAVRPTFGPISRGVVLRNMIQPDVPEYLDDGGLIARRIIQLGDRDEDVGAMLVRKAIWTVREATGDGSALTAVLFQAIYDQGLKHIAAGGNAARLRTCLNSALQVVLDELARITAPIRGRKKLAQFASGVCHDRELADVLGEVFDIIGEWGHLEVRKSNSQGLEREYVEGMYWETKPFSREMLTGPDQLRVELEDAAILISNLAINDPRQLVPFLDMVKQTGIRSCVLTLQKITDAAVGLLLMNNTDGLRIVAVETPYGYTPKQQFMMEDLALLTGGRPIVEASGERLGSLRAEDLGRARKAWADRTYFGIIGGRADPHALRRHLAALRASFSAAKDVEARQELGQRIARLTSGSATLWVGARTEPELNRRKALAVRTAEVLRGALREGVVPGGGVSLLACRPALRRCRAASRDPDERAAFSILLEAVEEPARTIIANAGWSVDEIMASINRSASGYGLDVERGEIINMAQAGILDSAGTVRLAMINAVAGAALTLATDVMIHRDRHFYETQP